MRQDTSSPVIEAKEFITGVGRIAEGREEFVRIRRDFVAS